MPLPELIETIESHAWTELHSELPADLRASLGCKIRECSSGVALITAGADVPGVNRVIALGTRVPTSESEIDDLIALYREAGVRRFLVHWSPRAEPAEAPGWLTERGFRLISPTLKLCYEISPAERKEFVTSLRISEIDKTDASTFENIVATGLGVQASVSAIVCSTLGNPGWHYYLAHDGYDAIAGAAMFVDGEGAWLGLMATVEAFRGRGAQKALLHRRLRDAKAAGCSWATADTAPPTSRKPNPSLHNMTAVGFTISYERPNYLL
jgi:hypothetical protein